MKISPSMLASDFTKMGEEIKKVTAAGADMIHMDVMDGNFVPNISFGASVIKALRPCSGLPFDTHLMISNPEKYIDMFADAGSDIITFHLESNSNAINTLNKIKSKGKKAGISIKPKTAAEEVFPYLPYVDLILIMTVEPGFGGQQFMPKQLLKSSIIYEKIKDNNLQVLIEVDGGINLETIKIVKEFPVDICVSGTCIFQAKDIKKTIRQLKSQQK